jgi:hypothetical protein
MLSLNRAACSRATFFTCDFGRVQTDWPVSMSSRCRSLRCRVGHQLQKGASGSGCRRAASG